MEAADLAEYARRCFDEGRRVDIDVADAKRWYLALSTLMRGGALDAASRLVLALTAAFPDSDYIARLAMLLDTMPPRCEDGGFADVIFRDDADYQLVRRTGATTLLIAFCGRYGGLGIPVPVAHRWFGTLNVHVAYLRDALGQGFVTGVRSLGTDRAETIAALRDVAAGLGADRIACYGNSAGGYGAMLYAAELGADAVVATNAVDLHASIETVERIAARIEAPHAGPDLHPLYEAAAGRIALTLVYNPAEDDDRAVAERLADVAGVDLLPVSKWAGHDAHIALIERRQFAAVLAKLVVSHRDATR